MALVTRFEKSPEAIEFIQLRSFATSRRSNTTAVRSCNFRQSGSKERRVPAR